MNSGAPFVALEVNAAGLKGSVWLNGVPVYEADDGAPRFVQAVVNHWVTDGPNTVQVHLAPAEGGASPAFSAKLARGEFGMESPPTQSLFDWRWNPARAPLTGVDPRMVLDRRVRIDHPYARWRWQGAPKRERLSEDDGRAIRRLVATLHRALSMRNVHGFVTRLQHRNREMATAFDLAYTDVTADLVGGLQGFVSAPGWAMAPLRDPEADVVLRRLADGRLVECRAPDGGPVLRGGDGTRGFAFPVMVSLLDDVWTVVR